MSENRNQEFCTLCPRNCPVDQLSCGRGRAFFGVETPQEEGYGMGHGCCHRGHHGPEGHGCGHGPHHGPEGHGCGHGPHHGPRGRCARDLPLEEQSLEWLLGRSGMMAAHGHHGRRGQSRILEILAQKGEMSQRELRELLGVEPGSLSEILGKLEAKGLVERRVDETDRRCQIMALTQVGRELAEKWAAMTGNGDLFAPLTDEERETLRGLLLKLLEGWRGARQG